MHIVAERFLQIKAHFIYVCLLTFVLVDVLENGGVKAICKEKIHQKFAIIDEKIVWYGSVNLLSFGRSEESMMRFEDAEVAAELLEDIQKQES